MPSKPFEKLLETLRGWLLIRYARAETYLKAYPSFLSKGAAIYVGIYFLTVGIVCAVLKNWLGNQANELMKHWISGFGPSMPVYNAPFVIYLILTLSCVAVFGIKGVYTYMPQLGKRVTRALEDSLYFLFIVALAMLVGAQSMLSRVFFAVASLAFFLPLLPLLMAGEKNYESNNISVDAKDGKPTFLQKYLPFIFLFPLILLLWIAAKAWYPVQITNDYFEIQDSVLLAESKSLPAASRSDVLSCLEILDRNVSTLKAGMTPSEIIEKNLFFVDSKFMAQEFIEAISKVTEMASSDSAKCNLDISSEKLVKLQMPLSETGKWQSQAGRLLYHHAYLVVPALHVLQYGIMSPIPYLYGVGNTLFHAMLLKATSPDLTNYFNTFPIAQLLGIVVLTLLVLYVTRSWLAVISSSCLILMALFHIGFQHIQLPPGFSPLRAAGFALQVASIFWLFRGKSRWRPIGAILATFFSAFWNLEFALVGAIGQGLALINPHIKYTLGRRAAYLVGIGVALIAYMLLSSFLERGYLHTMHLGLFGIFPMLAGRYFLLFCMAMAALLALLSVAAMKFEINERAARFCLLMVIALIMIKFLYYSWIVHFYYCLALIAPLAVMYFPWQRSFPATRGFDKRRWKIEATIALGLIFLCCFKSISYYNSARQFKEQMIEPFAKQAWTDLGENFTTTTPSEPVVSRVKAVRAQMKPNDTVLFLSPFDHLMSMYTNPERYCGHFENVTSLLTYDLIQSVVDCVRKSPTALVVYDDASAMPCPSYPRSKYYDSKSCGLKKVLQLSSGIILKELDPEFILVKKEGPLSFYRRRDGAASAQTEVKEPKNGF